MSEQCLQSEIDLNPDRKIEKIPTTFVALVPEKISLDSGGADLLLGVFHIMWSDMPAPRSYGLKLSDRFSLDGEYLGCSLVCTFPRETNVPFEIR